MEQQLQKAKGVVTAYTTIPGLFFAVMGFYTALNAMGGIVWLHWFYASFAANPATSNYLNLIINIILFGPAVVLVFAMILTSLYYSHTFGQVKSKPEQRAWVIGLAATAYVVYLLAEIFDQRTHSTISTALIVVAIFFFAYRWVQGRKHFHYIILAVIAFALSFVPLLSSNVYHWIYIVDSAPDWYTNNITICMGTLLGIGGILDHWQMRRDIKRIRQGIRSMAQSTENRAS